MSTHDEADSSRAPRHAAGDGGLDDLFTADEDAARAADGDAHRAPARAQKTPLRARRGPKIFLAAVLVVALLVLAALGVYLRILGNSLDNLHRDPSLMPDTTAVTPGQPINFVLMGSDSRGADQGRSDVLMVAHLSGDREHLYLVTFLRDMWVTIPANKVVNRPSKAKINAAYSWGGPALTIKTLQSITGVRMDHAVVIDFNGFKELTSKLGGVTLTNPQASKNRGYTFAKGPITLQGDQALAYVQERKDLTNGDLDRAARERAVLTAIIDKTLTGGVLANPRKLNDVLNTYADTMTVDAGLTNANVRKIATSLKFGSGKDIVQVQAPIAGYGKSKDGQDYDIVDEAGLKSLSTALKKDMMADYVANHPQ